MGIATLQFIFWPNTERIKTGGDDLNRGSLGFWRDIQEVKAMADVKATCRC